MTAVTPTELCHTGNDVNTQHGSHFKIHKTGFSLTAGLNCFRPRGRKKNAPSKFYIKPMNEEVRENAADNAGGSSKGKAEQCSFADGEGDNARVSCRFIARKLRFSCQRLCQSTITPQSLWYLSWLGLVTACFLYNILSIILRTAFQPEGYYSSSNYYIWMAVDYLCDTVYLIDLVFVKPRLQFIRNGLVQNKVGSTVRNYVKSTGFKFDLFSLLPLDLFYLYTGIFKAAPLLRLPRYLKLKTAWEFFDRCDQIAKNGYVVRVIRTMTYMLYLIHVETCGYYAISYYEGIGSNQWVFQGEGIAYIRCFYLATKTATSIGNNPKPTNQLEYVFMTIYWLSGVFVFALLIGQIRDIFESANSVKSHYQKTQDSTLQYLQNLNVPKQLQDKVREWFNYNWEQQKTLNENLLVDVLPTKMKTDLFLSVHIETLEHVSLFKNVDRSLLLDLILKLMPVIFLPGDIVCRKDEVGTEMYIVMHGEVEVVANDGSTLATLSKGHVFGEISLMSLTGGNRRTANVRSKGYSNLFVLSKHDFEGAMKDYPAAYAQLRMRAQKLLEKTPAKRDNADRKAEVRSISETPKQEKLFSSTLQKTSTEPSNTKEYSGSPNQIQVMPASETGDVAYHPEHSSIVSETVTTATASIHMNRPLTQATIDGSYIPAANDSRMGSPRTTVILSNDNPSENLEDTEF